ncbi:hypothetical protein [Acholeplasma granularum]|uniref:hypothetical protein n=1 Tax=Acholeplasma granularum TaxID=264635 RepID=UPI000685D321|nr:hypothetical protein [Acholeplasma granularum]
MSKLLDRMQLIADGLNKFEDVICLLGLGSLYETDRLDDYSDLDFFLIVKNGCKDKFIKDLSWLSNIPVTYLFKNTPDGYKFFYEDGIYGEFAVFSEEEISKAHYNKGKIFYLKEGYDPILLKTENEPKPKTVYIDYNMNEALTNIYVGLTRLKRGEVSSATTFIQTYAYNNILEIIDTIFPKEEGFKDLYVNERRIEFRHSNIFQILSNMKQGYLKNKESAGFIIDFINENLSPNIFIINQIKKLLD